MSLTAAETTELLPAREVQLDRAVRVGLIGGLTAMFIVTSGMLETFDLRMIVDPILSLGYVTLMAAPFAVGYVAGKAPPVLEGYAAPSVGARNVQAGAIAGALTGAIYALYALIIHVLDFSSVFIKLTEQTKKIVTLDMGAGGVLILALVMAVSGAVGGAVHLLERRWKRAVLYSAFWVVMFGLLEVLVSQIAFVRRISAVKELLYGTDAGLTLIGAVIIGGLVFAAYYYLDGRVRAATRRAMALEGQQRRRFILISLGVAIVFLAVLPQILGPFLSEVLDLAGVFLLMALGLNIVVGFAGLLDLGYVAFFAVGAYTTAILTSPVSPKWSPELSFWTAIPFIILAAAAAGVMVGTPVLRLRGDYLAIVTLGFGEIARILFLSDALKPYFGGAQGMLLIPDIDIGPFTIDDSISFFYPIYAFVILFAYLSYALQDSRVGRAWMAMREDESVAEAMGVNIVAAKLWAFVIGAIFAAIGGALFAHKIGSVFPESFAILVSITVLVLIIVGGMGSVPGVTVGALALVALPELLREFAEFKFLFYGTLLIFMMLNRPEGFIPSRRRARELHLDEVEQDAWLAQAAEQDPAPAE